MRPLTFDATAFLAGFCTLGLELAALRMFAPYFGASVYVTGSIITVVLVFMTVGYWVGGRVADKHPHAHWSMFLLLGAGVWAGLARLIYTPVLKALAPLSVLVGTVLGASALFGVSMVLLGAVAPFMVRLIAKGEIGTAAGRVSAIGTLGAILGSLGTTFVLLPTLGVGMTVLLLAACLVVFSLPVLAARKAVFAVALIVPLGGLFAGESASANVLYQGDSPYNHVVVHDSEVGRKLILNRPGWVQSFQFRDEHVAEQTYYSMFNAGPLLGRGRRVLVLGMGAGTSVVQLLDSFPDVSIDAVEIDPEVVRVAREYFDLPDDPRLKVHVADGRRLIRESNEEYDLIQLDVYQGGPYIPYYLVTQGAFAEIEARLAPDGVLMMNVLAPQQSDHRFLLVDAIGQSMANVFGSVFAADVEQNVILVATKEGAVERGAA